MNHKSKLSLLCLLGLLFLMTTQFAVEGYYQLSMINDITVSIPTKIQSFIYRNNSIMHKITFLSCNSLLYQMHIQDNHIFINIDTQYIISQSQCTKNQEDDIMDIRKYIRRVYYFRIQGKQVVFTDPYQQEILVFKRINKRQVQSYNTSINGSWQITFSQKDDINFLMIANQTHLSICETIYSYSFSKPYSAVISLAQNNNRCNFPFVNQILSKAQFYRNVENKLTIFDNDINQIVVGQFRNDIKRQLQTPVFQIPKPIEQGSKTFKNGNYIILLLYRRDLPRIRGKITNSILQFTLCSKLSFTIEEIGQTGLKISSQSNPDTSCRRDEQLYLKTFTSVTSYKNSESGSIILLDADNKEIINLTN